MSIAVTPFAVSLIDEVIKLIDQGEPFIKS